MSFESFPTNGENAKDYLEKLISNPESISPRIKQREEFILINGKDVPRTVFYKFVGDIAAELRTRVENTICLDDSSVFQLQAQIINLAEGKAEQSFDGHHAEIRPRDVAPIIRIIAEDSRVQCEHCLTKPNECKRRRPDAPIDKVYKRIKQHLTGLQLS